MDNAIYQFMDCNENKDGAPVSYPDLSQIADFSTAAEQTQQDRSEPRTMKFYPGVLESKYMQAVVRGGREGLLQFRENQKPGYPVPYPWPDWFDHERSRPSAGRKPAGAGCGQPTNDGYPRGCVAGQPAPIPACTDGGQNRVPSMYDPPQRAAAEAAQQAAADACAQQPPFVRAAHQEEACIPCSAAPEVYQNPTDPGADCSPQRPPPPPVHNTHQPQQGKWPQSTDNNFVPSYLHEPENMSKIIAHDYQRQWVCERDTWEESHATSSDAQHARMLSRCQQGEHK